MMHYTLYLMLYKSNDALPYTLRYIEANNNNDVMLEEDYGKK